MRIVTNVLYLECSILINSMDEVNIVVTSKQLRSHPTMTRASGIL